MSSIGAIHSKLDNYHVSLKVLLSYSITSGNVRDSHKYHLFQHNLVFIIPDL